MKLNTTKETITNCPQCEKHCSPTDLQCCKGRRFFKQLQADSYDESLIEENTSLNSEEGEHNHSKCKHSRKMGDHEMHQGKGFHGRFKPHCKRGPKKHLDEVENMDDLAMLIRTCSHYIAHQPHRRHGQGRILKILAQQGEVTQKELQEYLGIQSGSISEIISKLEMRGMVTKKKDENDKRKVILSITEEGKNKVESCSHNTTNHENSKEDLFQELTEQEQETLKQLLKKLWNSWN